MGAGTSKNGEKIKVPDWALKEDSEEEEKEAQPVKKITTLPNQYKPSIPLPDANKNSKNDSYYSGEESDDRSAF
jgi:hypothetical protein